MKTELYLLFNHIKSVFLFKALTTLVPNPDKTAVELGFGVKYPKPIRLA